MADDGRQDHLNQTSLGAASAASAWDPYAPEHPNAPAEDDDGCPEPDTDSDRIPDPVDSCVEEPEVYNGVDDEDGCPDEALVSIDINAPTLMIEILDKVYFATSRDIIKSRSFPVLNAVVTLLQAYPDIERVEVQGHTDSMGDDESNLDLSRRRAGSVARYLVEHGVDGQRLSARGYGEMHPIDSDKTREGPANNRRVQFVVRSETSDGTDIQQGEEKAKVGEGDE